jgi:hypothetical protein
MRSLDTAYTAAAPRGMPAQGHQRTAYKTALGHQGRPLADAMRFAQLTTY